jgi:diguanylate cyclase (GGDEF)-like protein/PAS domain S-box-containing protein
MFFLRSFRDWSISRKMTALFVAMSFVTAMIIVAMIGTFDLWRLKQTMVRDLSTLTEVLGRNSTAAISFHDPDVARDVLSALTAEPSITAACIYTADGQPLAVYARRQGTNAVFPRMETETTRFDKGHLILFRNIILRGERIGIIYIESDLEKLRTRIREYAATILITFLLTLALAFPVASGLKRPISEPVSSLVRTTTAISEAGDYSLRASLANRDEFGQLVTAFNAMLDQIEKRDQELRHHREHLEEEVAARTSDLRRAEEKYRAIFEDAIVGIFQTDVNWRPVSANAALAAMFGYGSPEQFVAEVPEIGPIMFGDPINAIELKRSLEHHQVVRGIQLQIRCRDGAAKWVLANIRAVPDAPDDLVRYEGNLEDISDRISAEERVQFLAYYDLLTGLPNRVLLRDRLAAALENSRRWTNGTAVLFVDLDQFKIINDSLGHSVGDLILQQAAERLKHCVREADTVARIGGDEFLIVLSSARSRDEVTAVADRILDSVAEEFQINGRSLRVTCSIGISVFPEHGEDAETLIKNADAAMYSAKDHGRSAFRFFTELMNAEVVERLTLENSLREALDKKQFFLVYQPQVNLDTRRITGWEALLRWKHPELGLIPPDKFIGIAESSGLIVPIGEWVLRTACLQMKTWHGQGLDEVPVAVNVSALQFRQFGLSSVVERALMESGLSPHLLELELTESLLLSNADVILSVLNELEAMGVSLAIDDFGTGYSSLSYLRELPVGKLKIDRSFINDVTTSTDDAAITTAIINMAKSMNLEVIAEGVETEEQTSFLRSQGCKLIQGYLISMPLTGEQIEDSLARSATPGASEFGNPAWLKSVTSDIMEPVANR